MTAFAALFALGATAGPPAPVPPPIVRLSDPICDAITGHLIAGGLWRFDADLSLVRDGAKVSVRVFLPEHQQSDRPEGAREAANVREALVRALQFNGLVVRFSDRLWCEKGRKGWDVLARAVGGSNPRAWAPDAS